MDSNMVSARQNTVWNLAEGKEIIKNFLQKENIPVYQQKFLENFIQLVDSFLQTLNEKYSDKKYREMVFSNPDYSASNAIEKYIELLQSAYPVIMKTMEELQSRLADEFKLLNANPSKTPEYHKLLITLGNCVNGVYKTTQDMIEKIQKSKKSLLNIADMFDKLGIVYLPMHQELDSLAGTRLNEKSMHAKMLGQCHGHSLNFAIYPGIWLWTNEIIHSLQKKEESKKIVNANVVSNDLTETARENNAKSKASSKNLLNFKNIEKLIPPKNSEIPHVIELAQRGALIGHEIIIRRVNETKHLELFDPNFGIFLFKNKEQFIHTFAFLLEVYRLRTIHFDDFNFYPAFDKAFVLFKSNNNSVLPSIERKVEFIADQDQIDKLINTYEKFAVRIKQKEISHMTLETLADTFIDSLQFHIAYIKDPDVLDSLTEKIKRLDFLNTEKK